MLAEAISAARVFSETCPRHLAGFPHQTIEVPLHAPSVSARQDAGGTLNHPRNSEAGLLEAWEVPQIRKRSALFGLHRLHRTVVAFEEDAFAIGFVHQCESLPILAQSRELLDEVELAQSFESRELREPFIAQAHLAGPPAAGGASLAF